MTGKTFRLQIYLTLSMLVLISLLLLWGGVVCPQFGEASRSAVTVSIAVAAAWLTYCLQRRVAYTNALRALWERMVDTVHGTIQYTYTIAPEQAQHLSVLAKLGCRIDEVRCVFKNVGEKDAPPTTEAKNFVRAVKSTTEIDGLNDVLNNYHHDVSGTGVYPFESLKQIHTVIVRLGHGAQVTPERAKTARRSVETLWRIMRSEMLKEMDRDYPEFPDTPHSPRRSARTTQY